VTDLLQARRRIGSMQVLVVGMVALAVFGGALRGFVIGNPDIATAATVFCGIFVQAIPFLALGVVIMCCAADARLAQIRLTGPAAPEIAAYPENTWVSVEGKIPTGQSDPSGKAIPVMDVLSQPRTDPPPNRTPTDHLNRRGSVMPQSAQVDPAAVR
jgi:hypothetical protein